MLAFQEWGRTVCVTRGAKIEKKEGHNGGGVKCGGQNKKSPVTTNRLKKEGPTLRAHGEEKLLDTCKPA